MLVWSDVNNCSQRLPPYTKRFKAYVTNGSGGFPNGLNMMVWNVVPKHREDVEATLKAHAEATKAYLLKDVSKITRSRPSS